MNGYRAFGVESSAWRDGFEAGKRTATALKEHNVTAEEAVLHIKKILDAYNKEYNDMGAIEQMRHEGEIMGNALDEITYIIEQTDNDH